MRTIKFRGKRLLSNDWEYGNLIQRPDGGHFIETGDLRLCPVQDFSVGQFTGLLDKNGKEIFEGDVFHLGDPRITYVVFWIDCGLKAKQIGSYGSFCGVTYWADNLTIVGNIHDNPELLDDRLTIKLKGETK